MIEFTCVMNENTNKPIMSYNIDIEDEGEYYFLLGMLEDVKQEIIRRITELRNNE